MSFVTHIHDLIRGTSIAKTKRFLDKSEKWTVEKMEAYRLEKLQKLVKFSYGHVPYYTQLMDSVCVKPSDIRNLSDIQKIPISTKDMVRKKNAMLLADNVNLKDRRIKEGKTGGTTGAPLKLYKNAQTRGFTWGAYRRWHGWMGVKYADKTVVLWGDPTLLHENRYVKLKERVINKLSHRLEISSFNLNEKTLPEVADRIMQFKPVLLRGYLSAILQVAKYFEENNLTLPSLKAVLSTTETLLPPYRIYIRHVFGVETYDQYGCGECSGMAFECAAHNGLHISEEHCLMEIVDEAGRNIYDTAGRVVVTDLDNYAMPFIRYENGDSAVKSSQKCSCGRTSELLTSISGRTHDLIYLKSGSPVNGIFFTNLFHELGYDNFEYFTRFQIYQKTKGDFVCRLEKTKIQIPERIIHHIQSALLHFANNVVIELYDKLPNDTSGKFRYLFSELED
ncbi:MAG: hypothetical protein LBV26_05810 [Bacteroidales bacterium]|jgi:phenylacetate-CoA ligase|nr:hypothetical protein [Bacteroidales bacterium]